MTRQEELKRKKIDFSAAADCRRRRRSKIFFFFCFLGQSATGPAIQIGPHPLQTVSVFFFAVFIIKAKLDF